MAEKSWRKRTLGNRVLKPETLMMGYGYDPMLSEGSLKPPQFQTSTFVFRSAQHGKDFFAAIQGRRKLGPDEEPGLIYSRFKIGSLRLLVTASGGRWSSPRPARARHARAARR